MNTGRNMPATFAVGSLLMADKSGVVGFAADESQTECQLSI